MANEKISSLCEVHLMHSMSRGLTILTMAFLAAMYMPSANAKGGGGGHGGGGHGSGSGAASSSGSSSSSSGSSSGASRGVSRGGSGGRGGYNNYQNQDTQNTNPYVNQATDTSNYGRGSSH
jgi:hypothetical protein